VYIACNKHSLQQSVHKVSNIPRVVFVGAIFVFLFTSLYNIYVFEHVPHIHDEIVYLFQAKIFRTGHLYTTSPCAPASFNFPHMINTGKWYSIYPPGFPFLLLLGLLLNAPFLVNPSFGTMSIVLFYFLGKEIYDRKTGIASAILASLSPWLLLMSSTMMSHTTSMFFNSLFFLFVLKSIRKPSALYGALAGSALGMAFLIRPYNAVVFSLVFIGYYLYYVLRDFRRYRRNIFAFIMSGLVFVGILLAYNQKTNGNPLTMGYIAHYGKSYSVIFGRPATQSYDYTPLFGTFQIRKNLAAINSYLFGWPFSSLWLLVPLFWAMKRSPADRRKALLMISGFFMMVIGFYFFWGSFVFLGARMFFDTMPILILLSARGLVEAVPLLRSMFHKLPKAPWKIILPSTLAVFSIYAFVVRFPDWIRPPNSDWYYLRYDNDMAGASAHIKNAVASMDIHNAIIIMKFLYAPLPGFPTGWWGSGFMFNTPRLDGDIIFANDQGPLNEELYRCYPNRRFFMYIGTLERGLLIPISMNSGRPVLAAPLIPESRSKKSSLLLHEPTGIFKLYSREFAAFLEALYKENDIAGVNVIRLQEIGLSYQKAHEYTKAAFCFEAALQLEKEPQMRFNLLNSLNYCYIKSGQLREAKILGKRLANAEDLLYSMIPERGF